VTKKLQVTIPKAVADAHGIRPGADLEFESAGEVIRVRPRQPVPRPAGGEPGGRLRAFDEATERQRARDATLREAHPEIFASRGRGWRREDLYDRGLPR
jgi:AbrB family looped-hinge helix DNA binding protein